MSEPVAIEGVAVRPLVRDSDERGSLTELLRSDWPEFRGFGQALLTVNLPGVIRGWHWHERQTDVIVVVRGTALVPLYDGRPGSPSHGRLMELVVGGEELTAITVPPGVYHGYRTLSQDPAMILNFPDRTYDPSRPDERRVPFDSPDIGYHWGTR